jgi:hypothetical protein
MDKKNILLFFLLAINASTYTMHSHEGFGWNSDSDKDEETVTSAQSAQSRILSHINNSKLGPAGREAVRLLQSIENDPHSSSSADLMEAILAVKEPLIELASFKGQSNTPPYRDFNTRVNSAQQIIDSPSASPIRHTEAGNAMEDINNS